MNSQELSARLLQFGARSIRVASALNRSAVGRHVAMQLVRAATSAGANYCAASGSESRDDCLHKMQISLKELRESEYWLRLICETQLRPPRRLREILDEVDQLIRIFVAAITTYKSRRPSVKTAEDRHPD